jgi:hypothetical protein
VRRLQDWFLKPLLGTGPFAHSLLSQEAFLPGSFSQIVQIAMSLRDTTMDEMTNFRESRAISELKM